MSAELSGGRRRGFLARAAPDEVNWGTDAPFLHRQADALRTGDAFLSIRPRQSMQSVFGNLLHCHSGGGGKEKTPHRNREEHQSYLTVEISVSNAFHID